MIDTIRIHVPINRATLQFGDDDRFTYRTIKPPKHLIAQGTYFPRVTLNKLWYRQRSNIKIEFSAPKIVFGNNLQELAQTDLHIVVSTLRERLSKMGVIIEEDQLFQASVSAVHYSKNVILNNGYRSEYILNQLNRLNISKRFGVAEVQYRDNGHAFYVYTGTHHLIVYDKAADSRKPKSRATDKDRVRYTNFNEEILRFEVRLTKRQKIISFFKEMGCSRDPTLQTVFDEDQSKGIILHYWKNILGVSKSHVFTIQKTENDLLRDIVRTNSDIKPKELLMQALLISISKRNGGLRELREIMSPIITDRTWYRYCRELEVVSEKLDCLTCDWVDQIENSLNNFNPIQTLVCQEK